MKKYLPFALLLVLVAWVFAYLGSSKNAPEPTNEPTTVATESGTTTGTWTASGASNVPSKTNIVRTESTIPEVKVGDVVIKDIELVKTTNGTLSQEVKFIKRKKDETSEQFLARIGKANSCYLNQYVSYHYDLLNGRGGKVVFDNTLAFDYDKSGKIIQVSKITKREITAKEFLEQNPVMKEDFLRRKQLADNQTDAKVKEDMMNSLKVELESIPSFVYDEKKVDTDVSKITFRDVISKYEQTENCKEKLDAVSESESGATSTGTTK